MTHPYAFALSDNVQGLRTGPPSFVTSAFFDLPLPCPNSLPGSSPELCVKVRGSSSMLRLGCLGDLLGLEE